MTFCATYDVPFRLVSETLCLCNLEILIDQCKSSEQSNLALRRAEIIPVYSQRMYPWIFYDSRVAGFDLYLKYNPVF